LHAEIRRPRVLHFLRYNNALSQFFLLKLSRDAFLDISIPSVIVIVLVLALASVIVIVIFFIIVIFNQFFLLKLSRDAFLDISIDLFL